ncbi:MAG: HAD family phosphatase [Patescibacteria group bacterium]|nr:HAD family phosphatase [Patescibacteria group bacterium]
MKIKAVVLDFDGTITTADILNMLCDLVGKKEESEKLDTLFREGKVKGLETLVQRINFLKGLSLEQIRAVVSKNDYLQKGALEFFTFLRENNIVSIIASGNIMPLLEIYKEKLGADYLVGSKPIIENGGIVSISEKEYSGDGFKVRDIKSILEELDISPEYVVAIGDSPADRGMFELSAKSIAINPKGNIAQCADYVIENDLSKAIPILKDLMNFL